MSNKREYAIGEEVKFLDVVLIVEEDNGLGWCQGCYHNCGYDDNGNRESCFRCFSHLRTDNKDVIFKLKDD